MRTRIILALVAAAALAGCRTTRAALIGDCGMSIARPADQTRPG
jgi:hypothetical protein